MVGIGQLPKSGPLGAAAARRWEVPLNLREKAPNLGMIKRVHFWVACLVFWVPFLFQAGHSTSGAPKRVGGAFVRGPPTAFGQGGDRALWTGFLGRRGRRSLLLPAKSGLSWDDIPKANGSFFEGIPDILALEFAGV